MTDKKRERLRKHAQDKHDRVVAEAKATLERELSAIDSVCDLEASVANPHETEGQRNPDLSAMVLQVIPAEGRFRAEDVQSLLKGQGLNGSLNPKSVSNALKRISTSANPVIRVAELGKGRRPTFYEKIIIEPTVQ